MVWIRCVRCEKWQRDLVAQTFALIAPVQYVLQQVSCSYETSPNAPKYYETDRKLVYRPMGWIGCIRCEKSHRDFVARIGCIGCVRCEKYYEGYEMIPNAPKHNETHQNMSLGSNGVDQVRSLRKIPTRLRGINFCINCTSSAILHRV